MWQSDLKDLISSPEVLLEYLELDPSDLPLATHTNFPLRVPLCFVKKMKKGDPNDPLLLQVLTQSKESLLPDKFSQDPLSETSAIKVPGLMQKFKHRVLITLTGSCAIHCRYCFRRHFPYQKNLATGKYWDNIFSYLKNDTSLFEVILSGGDPLMLTNTQLTKILKDLDTLKHIDIIRFHTRLPVVIPSRINEELIKILRNCSKKFVFVYHINHPQELCDSIKEGADKLQKIGVSVFNQAVLLKNINDSVNVLKSLSLKCFSHNIQPYYLHLLDRVQGAAHFEIEEAIALDLYKKLQAELPGYLVPKLVQEVPNQPNKILKFQAILSDTQDIKSESRLLCKNIILEN